MEIGKRFDDRIDFLSNDEEEEKKAYGLILHALDDGRFEIIINRFEGGEKVLGYLNDEVCAAAFARLIEMVASGEAEARTPTEEEVERYFKGRRG